MAYFYHGPTFSPSVFFENCSYPAYEINFYEINFPRDEAMHFVTPSDAQEYMQQNPRDGWTITFYLSERETHQWLARETNKVDRGIYASVPWIGDDWVNPAHYCHLSMDSPGYVAYTATDEHGYLDRQTKTTPGRYLAKFAPHLTAAEVAAYVAQVKGTDAYALKIARSTDEIVATFVNGPPSCMGGKSWERRTHPCVVYGDSDLGVAYTGNLDGKVSSRCVIWPDKRLYSRVYGDDVLKVLLEKNGYVWQKYFDGAKIRAIRSGHRNSYVMPYIDSSKGADLADGGRMFRLTGEERGEVSTGTTEGTSSAEEPTQTCERCQDEYPEDEYPEDGESGNYCPSCEASRNFCPECDTDTWDDLIDVGGESVSVCEDCASRIRETCAIIGCDNTWYPGQFTLVEREHRNAFHTSDLCTSCATGQQGCAHCDNEVFDDTLPTCPTCHMTVRCDYTRDLLAGLIADARYAPLESPTTVLTENAQSWAESAAF